MELIKELFNELTLVGLNESIPPVENQAKVRQLRKSMEGLLKVLFWKLEGQISAEEFRKLYHEWLRNKGILETPLQTRVFFLNQAISLNRDITSSSSFSQLFTQLCRDL